MAELHLPNMTNLLELLLPYMAELRLKEKLRPTELNDVVTAGAKFSELEA